MERPLAALAFDPKVTILFLVQLKLLFPLNIDFFDFSIAVGTHYILIRFQYIFAAETSFLHFCKFEQTQI